MGHLIGCDLVVVEVIGSVRDVVNEQPRLLITNGKDPGAASEGARKERERRSSRGRGVHIQGPVDDRRLYADVHQEGRSQAA